MFFSRQNRDGKKSRLGFCFFVMLLITLPMNHASLAAAPAKTSSKSASKSTKSSAKSSSSKATSTKSKSTKASTVKKDEEKEEKSSGKKREADEEEEDQEQSKPSAEEEAAKVTPETLPGLIDPIIKSVSSSSSWSARIGLQGGQTLYEHNAGQKMIPASNRKLFTGALALDQLGPDFRFRSYLYYTGNLESSSTLNGNLVIKPSGDPTFSLTMYKGGQVDWVFRDWAEKTVQAGILYVKGDLLIDCSDWDMTDMSPKGWAPRVLQDNYAPQTSPLTLNENLITVIVNPGAKGAPGEISFAPPATGYPIINKTETGGKGGVSVRRTINGPLVVSGGANKAGAGAKLPVDNPTLFAAANLRHHLRNAGVHIQGSVRIVTSKRVVPPWNQQNLIAAVESLPLLEILKHMMKRSDNHMAEQIFVAISAAKLGQGSYRASRRLEDDLLQRAGIRPDAVQFFDGSGLSETNRVSAEQMTHLLSYMLTHQYAKAFIETLAVGGRDGTLRNRMKTEKLQGKVFAKTGTINSVVTLSGYLMLSQDKTVVFSFLVNNIRGISARSIQDRILGICAGLQFPNS